MKDFIFLFRFKEGFDDKKTSREEFQKEAAKWQAWTEKLMQEGRLTPGNRLVSSGKVMKGRNREVQDGPFAEGKEMVGGFCTVKAHNLDEALGIAKDCPIFDQDGSVEVRGLIVNQ
jgi:hypothetical protein